MRTIGLISNKKNNNLFLLPDSVATIARNSVVVYVAAGYGKAMNISDKQYADAGATIVDGNAQVIKMSDIVCKVDAFTKSEISKMSGKIAITMANYLVNVDMLYYMLKNNVTGLAWNNLTDDNGYIFFPEIEKIKGVNAVKVIADGMKKGLSKAKDKVVYPHPAKLLILNATFAGVAAAKYALQNGFDVMILDHDKDYLKQLNNDSEIESITQKVKTKFTVGDASFENLEHQIKKANAFINTSINPEDRTRARITNEMANSMPVGSILYDAGSEYGYAFAWIRKFVKSNLTYAKFNKVFYVTMENNTDLFANKLSEIVSNGSSKTLIEIAKSGQSNNFIAKTIICNKGKVVDLNVKSKLTLY